MKFDFRNLGTLSKAELELGKLTVVCGNNNTSKTLICNAIYGFLQHMRASLSYSATELLPKDIENKTDFEIDLNDIIHKVEKYTDEFQENFAQNIHRVFDVDSDLVSNTSVRIEKKSISPNFNDSYDYSIGGGVVAAKREIKSSRIKFRIPPAEINKKRPDIKELSATLLFHACYFTMFPKPSILTSERSGIAIFQKELDSKKNSIVDELKGNEDKEIIESISRYAISIRDNISTIRDTEQISKQKSFLPQFVEFLNAIVEGKYIVSDRNVMFEIADAGQGTSKRLPMHYSSSSVKSLFLLYSYLAYTATPNDILIIDEPELSLHPDNQRKLLRLLVRLCNSGVRVFITTHSDFFIKELNILIMLREMNNHKFMKKFMYELDETIDKEDIKIYFVNKHKLTNLDIDKFGVDIDTFNKEIDNMNNIYDALSEELS